MAKGESVIEQVTVGRTLLLDRGSALALLRRISTDRSVMLELRRLYAEEVGRSALHSLKDETVLEQLAERVARGELTISAFRPAERPGPTEGEEGEAIAAAAVVEEKPAKTWIEFCVIWASGGAPVPSIELVITLPSGSEQKKKTDKQGKIRLDGVEAGAFAVHSEKAEKIREETLVFLGMGGIAQSGQSKEEEKPYRIVAMSEHRVKSGETLKSLAEKTGTTWQNLAKFNWGTDDPKEINHFLRHDVGCSKKDQDGNYLFDDTDEPGIVLLPGPWKEQGLSGGKTYVIEVGKSAKEKPWIFSM
jgi:hypothetical protein